MRESGSTAVVVAASMFLLLGVAAVAVDISAGFNERNQNQNAGDNGVMAGALEKAEATPNEQAMVLEALTYVQANLTAQFPGGMTDPDWVALWRSCVDAGNPNWIPLPEPVAWGGMPGATLDCISQTSSLLRIRVPDQLTATSFGKVLGASALTTNAISIAKVVLQQTAPPLVPFGVGGDASSGELCLASSGSGTAYPPCTGPQTGSFGSIISPLFGDFGSHAAQCSGNTNFWFARNIVWGIDHEIDVWPSAPPLPAPYPGQSAVLAFSDTFRDDCQLDPDGNAAPLDGLDINTMLVDTGYPNPALTDGLASNAVIEGRSSRLQQPNLTYPNETRPVRDQNATWDLDNVGPWMYLTDDPVNPSECRYSHYYVPATNPPIPNPIGPSTTVDRVADFEACLAMVESSGAEVFDAGITDSPRFVWVPQYAYLLPVSGQKFNPIREIRAAFIGATWYNCPSPMSAAGCAFVFYPDMEESSELCDPNGSSCKKATVSQLSAWLLPVDSIPQSVKDDFQSAFDNLAPELYQ